MAANGRKLMPLTNDNSNEAKAKSFSIQINLDGQHTMMTVDMLTLETMIVFLLFERILWTTAATQVNVRA